jgi:hypothetical protein
MAITFPGSGVGHYSISSASHPNTSGDWTLMGRWRLDSLSLIDYPIRVIFYNGDSAISNAVLLDIDGTNNVTFGILESFAVAESQSITTLVVGRNYHFAIVHDATAVTGTTKLYIDGVLAITLGAHTVNTEDATLGGGVLASGGTSQIQGAFACIKMWTAALSLSEVQAEVDSVAAVRSSNLWDTWRFNTYDPSSYAGTPNGHSFNNQSGGETLLGTDLPIRVVLASGASGEASATGALSTQILPVAAAKARAAVTAALTIPTSAVAASSSIATSTAALTNGIRAAAAATAFASASAALTSGTGVLAAALRGSCSVAAALSTQIRVAADAQSEASQSAALTTVIRAAADSLVETSSAGALTTQIQTAAAAAAYSSAVASLTTGAGVIASTSRGTCAVAAALSTSIACAAVSSGDATTVAGLTNWATVTLSGTLYAGAGSAVDPLFWGSPIPTVGTTLYYDATHINIATNGEIDSDTNDCSAIVQFFDGSTWQIGTIVITPFMVAYSVATQPSTATLTTQIALASDQKAKSSVTANVGGSAALNATVWAMAASIAALTTGIALLGSASSETSAVGTLSTGAGFAAVSSVQSRASLSLSVGAGNYAAALASARVNGVLLTGINLASAAIAEVNSMAALSTGSIVPAESRIARFFGRSRVIRH